jgi:hypothetical protein
MILELEIPGENLIDTRHTDTSEISTLIDELTDFTATRRR